VKPDKFNLNVLFSTLDEIELAWPEVEL